MIYELCEYIGEADGGTCMWRGPGQLLTYTTGLGGCFLRVMDLQLYIDVDLELFANEQP